MCRSGWLCRQVSCLGSTYRAPYPDAVHHQPWVVILIVEATTHYNEPEIVAEVSKGLGEPMVGINVSSLAQDKLMAGRGW
jgi:hypothetical protein